MARHYSTKDFFRQMPNALLTRYFQAREVFGELYFATGESRNIITRLRRGSKIKGA